MHVQVLSWVPYPLGCGKENISDAQGIHDHYKIRKLINLNLNLIID